MEDCKSGKIQNWLATDAGLRRMLARSWTVLSDKLRKDTPENFEKIIPFLFSDIHLKDTSLLKNYEIHQIEQVVPNGV